MVSARVPVLTLVLVVLLTACRTGGGLASKPRVQVQDESFSHARESNKSIADWTHQLLKGLPPALPPCGRFRKGEPHYGGTAFAVSKGAHVFFGGNHNYNNPDSYYWVDPGEDQDYGVIWIGTPGNVQQGVNDAGLAFDANDLPEVGLNPHPERIAITGGIKSVPIHILHQCTTVEDVIKWVQTHQWPPAMNKQMQFADASGDAVVIGPGPDGELIFTRKSPGDGYLTSSNFSVTDPNHGYGHPCSRYDKAQEILGQLLDQDGELTVRDAVKVLDATHQEGGTSWTVQSIVADLPNGQVYLYYFSQFNEPVVLNVVKEIANPRPSGPLSKLFPADVQHEAARRYQRIQANASRCRLLSFIWAPAVFACVVPLITLSLGKKRERGRRRGLLLWVPVVTVLGPLGFLVWFAVARSRQPSIWRTALVEASGDVTPTVVAYAAYLALTILVPEPMSGQLVPWVLVFGLPLAVGWLAFQGPLLALASKQSYRSILGQRLPQAMVAAILGMAGIPVVAAPLVRKSSQPCFTLGALWAIVVLGALVGGSLLFVYELWAGRRGFHAWSALTLSQNQVLSPPWRRLKWWIPLSYAVLFGSLVLSMILQQL